MDSVPVRVRGDKAPQMTTESASTRESKSPNRQRKPLNLKKRLIVVVAIVVLLACAAVAWLWAASRQTDAIDSSKYQAVFFTNGQVYFGKLAPLNDNYMKLTDIYYLQAQSNSTNSSNPQQASDSKSSDVQLIKLGNEVHGPEDEMIISKDQILFFENLKQDGKVTDSINKYQSQNK